MPWYHRALRNSWVQGDFQENRMLALGKLNHSVIYSYPVCPLNSWARSRVALVNIVVRPTYSHYSNCL